MKGSNYCVMCGREIPEGTQICYECRKRNSNSNYIKIQYKR